MSPTSLSAFSINLTLPSHSDHTCRPSLPKNVQPPGLEPEIIGFYLGNVMAYVEAAFTDHKIAENVQLYLQARQLIQRLMRIPIQLDARSVQPGTISLAKTSRRP